MAGFRGARNPESVAWSASEKTGSGKHPIPLRGCDWRGLPLSRSLQITPDKEKLGMRIAIIVIGIILLGLGVWVAVGAAHYSDTKAEIGPVKVTKQQPVPAPVGYAGIVIGGILIVAGALKKN
jgi:hypothetical protein